MKEHKKGFTIIEITLAMTFLAILMVSIATLIMRITNIYQKGLAMRAINATGTEIIEDITRTVGAASYLVDIHSQDAELGGNGVMEYDNNYKLVEKYYYDYTVYNESHNGKNFNVQYFGVLCTGDYSYIWNTARALDPDFTAKNFITVNGEKVKMVRVYDREQAQCNKDKNGSVANLAKRNRLPVAINVPEDNVVELINNDEMDLALYEFNITPATQSAITRQSFISANFILATRQGGININANGDFCRGEDNEFKDEYEGTMFNYCAVNKFSFSARTGGNADKEG
ncbi:MAG: type II secretion system protein [Candidatus Nanosyncoccaceae bacterium]